MTPVKPERPTWAQRIRQDRVRALYRSEAAGLLDEELLMEVGWALWARARDVAHVSRAHHSGWVACPACGERARWCWSTGFLHALHNGPLAPLFVQGGRESVARLLDEIGGIKRGTSVL